MEEAREKLETAQQESAEWGRRAKTEQLRAVMLREAFEQEQVRINHSLNRAEGFVNELAAATESTRREEAKLCQLRRDLYAAKVELANAEQAAFVARPEDIDALAARAAADYAKVESERHAEAAQLTETRWKLHTAASNARRRAADVCALQRDLQAAMREAAGLAGEHPGADPGDCEASPTTAKQARSRRQALVALAETCASSFAEEFRLVKQELSTARPSITTAQGLAPGAELGADLQAAALQRRVGRALAAELDHQCSLQEEALLEQLGDELIGALRQRLAGLNGAVQGSAGDGQQSSEEVEQYLQEEIERVAGHLQHCSEALRRTEDRLKALQS